MQHTLYELTGVHMLLPSGGDIVAIRVTHVWVLCARLDPVTCRATSTANYALTQLAEVCFWTIIEETTRQLHVVLSSLSQGYVYEMCLLWSVTIGCERWHGDPH
jgi:hypothetical protein